MEDDPVLRETSCDPKFRRALVTDGKSAVGRAVVKALLDAGATTVFVGDPSDPDNLVTTDIVAVALSPYFRQPGDVDTVPASLRRH